MKDIYVIRHGPKVRAHDAVGTDNNGIHGPQTEELVANLPFLSYIQNIATSSMNRTQATAEYASQFSGAPVQLAHALSPFIEPHTGGPNQPMQTSGPYFSGEVDFVLPLLDNPLITKHIGDISQLTEWQAIKGLAALTKAQMGEFWTYAQIGERASNYLARADTPGLLGVSHSGILEPMIAHGLGRDFTYVADAIGETQWSFCEPAKLSYDSQGLAKVAFRGETLRRK